MCQLRFAYYWLSVLFKQATETDTVVNFLFVQASDIDNDLCMGDSHLLGCSSYLCSKKQLVFNPIVYKPQGNTFIFPSLQHILPRQRLQAERSSTHKNCGIGGLKLILETQLKSLQRLLPRI